MKAFFIAAFLFEAVVAGWASWSVRYGAGAAFLAYLSMLAFGAAIVVAVRFPQI